jgi:hypothetical protein
MIFHLQNHNFNLWGLISIMETLYGAGSGNGRRLRINPALFVPSLIDATQR